MHMETNEAWQPVLNNEVLQVRILVMGFVRLQGYNRLLIHCLIGSLIVLFKIFVDYILQHINNYTSS